MIPDGRLNRLSDGVELSLNDYKFDGAVIASTDSDMYQLLKYDGVYIDSSTIGRNLLSRTESPKAVKNLPPECIPAFKMIVGDVSDNVPSLNLTIPELSLIKLIKTYLNSDEKVDEFID